MSDKFINQTGLARLLDNLKASFSQIGHKHSASDVNSGTLDAERIPNLSATKITSGTFPTTAKVNTQSLVRPSGILNDESDVTLQALVSTVRANRLAFLPADQIIIEKTTDGGITWVDAEISDAIKMRLFSELRPQIKLPVINEERNTLCGLRITITAMKYNVPDGTPETGKYNYWSSDYVQRNERYCQFRDFYFWVNSGSDRITCKIESATGSAPNTWVTRFSDSNFRMTGWSGKDFILLPNAYTFGGSSNQTSNHWNWRFTFMTALKTNESSLTGTTVQYIHEIRAYGDAVWTNPYNLMRHDHLYSFDENQNATFPAKLMASGGFSGTLTGALTGVLKSRGRKSSANLSHVADDYGSMQYFLATSYMASSGTKPNFYTANGALPASDGHILHFAWDSSWQYNAQLALSNRNDIGLSIRGNYGGTWSSWIPVATADNCETGDENGQVKIAGTNVSVKGLGALAFKDSVEALTDSEVLTILEATS